MEPSGLPRPKEAWQEWLEAQGNDECPKTHVLLLVGRNLFTPPENKPGGAG